MTGVWEGSAAGRAQTLNDLGRATEALSVVSSGLAQDPRDVNLLVQGAVALVQLDRDDEAVRYCLAAAATDPDSAVVQKVLSVALRGAGDKVGAYYAAVRATQLAPHDPGAHIQVAHAASDLRDRHNGRTAAEYALRLAPSSPAAHLAMTAALFPPGPPPPKETLREAEEHARTALELRPDDHVALNELARIQMARGRLVSAAGQPLHVGTSRPVRDGDAAEHGPRPLGPHRPVPLGAVHRLDRRDPGRRGPPGASRLAGCWCWSASSEPSLWASSCGSSSPRCPRTCGGGSCAASPAGSGSPAAWGVCLLLTCLLFLAAAVSPAPAALTLFFVGGAPLFVGAVLSWIRFFRDRRAS